MNEKPDETSIFHGHHLEPDGSCQPMPPMPPMPFLGFDGALPSLLAAERPQGEAFCRDSW